MDIQRVGVVARVAWANRSGRPRLFVAARETSIYPPGPILNLIAAAPCPCGRQAFRRFFRKMKPRFLRGQLSCDMARKPFLGENSDATRFPSTSAEPQTSLFESGVQAVVVENVFKRSLAGEPGFEPGLTESESVGLPLTYSPKLLGRCLCPAGEAGL
jgi:hypothetical protein